MVCSPFELKDSSLLLKKSFFSKSKKDFACSYVFAFLAKTIK